MNLYEAFAGDPVNNTDWLGLSPRSDTHKQWDFNTHKSPMSLDQLSSHPVLSHLVGNEIKPFLKQIVERSGSPNDKGEVREEAVAFRTKRTGNGSTEVSSKTSILEGPYAPPGPNTLVKPGSDADRQLAELVKSKSDNDPQEDALVLVHRHTDGNPISDNDIKTADTVGKQFQIPVWMIAIVPGESGDQMQIVMPLSQTPRGEIGNCNHKGFTIDVKDIIPSASGQE